MPSWKVLSMLMAGRIAMTAATRKRDLGTAQDLCGSWPSNFGP